MAEENRVEVGFNNQVKQQVKQGESHFFDVGILEPFLFEKPKLNILLYWSHMQDRDIVVRNEDIIKETARKYFPDAEVILFGSRARQVHVSDSDYDILVITHKDLTPGQKLPYKTKIRKELLKSDIRTDILIQSHKEVEVKKQLPGHIIRNIFNDLKEI